MSAWADAPADRNNDVLTAAPTHHRILSMTCPPFFRTHRVMSRWLLNLDPDQFLGDLAALWRARHWRQRYEERQETSRRVWLIWISGMPPRSCY